MMNIRNLDQLSVNVLKRELVKVANEKHKDNVVHEDVDNNIDVFSQDNEIHSENTVSQLQYSIYDVAKHLMNKGELLSNKKLQKLVYYAYAWYLVYYNKNENELKNKLFNEHMQAWTDGPVFPCLFDAYNENIIYQRSHNDIQGEAQKMCDKIWNVYGKYSGNALGELTHKEYPWENAMNKYTNGVNDERTISDEDIYNFYKSKIK